MSESWVMHVEIEFPTLDGDLVHRYLGDAEIDFSRRALKRVRPQLQTLTEHLSIDGQVAHYHVISPPRRIV